MTTGQITGSFRLSDGGHLQYAVAGAGAPVVLLHGFGLDLSLWDPQWDLLTSRYRTLRYDLRGYGASSLPTGPYSHSEDFREITAQFDGVPVHLIGLSMGGRHALRIAAERPEAIRSLTLIDPALDGHAWSESWMARWRAIAAAATSDVSRAKQLWLEHELFAPARARAPVAKALEAMVHRYSGWHFKHKDPAASPSPPTTERLSSIAAPTLLLVGERDIEDFQLIARRLVSEMPRVSRHVLPNVGHLANLEDPAHVNELILAHLAGCSE